MCMRQNLFSAKRSLLLMVLYSFFFILILVKLFDTQVLKSSYWRSVAKSQQTGFIKNYSKRGEIIALSTKCLFI